MDLGYPSAIFLVLYCGVGLSTAVKEPTTPDQCPLQRGTGANIVCETTDRLSTKPAYWEGGKVLAGALCPAQTLAHS